MGWCTGATVAFAFTVLASWPPTVLAQGCEDGGSSNVEAVFLFDLHSNLAQFHVHRRRTIDTVNHIESLTKGRSKAYSLVGFHRSPVRLLALNSPYSNAEKLIQLLEDLRPKENIESSASKALDEAAQQLSKNAHSGVRSLVFLVHDGSNTDLVAETLDALNSLQKVDATVFVITSGEEANELALQGYLDDHHERLYRLETDKTAFFKAIDLSVGVCRNSSGLFTSVTLPPRKPVFLPLFSANLDQGRKSTKSCSKQKTDLMILLDTSGSEFTAFAKERRLLVELLNAVNKEIYTDRLQVSVVRFSSEPQVALPFQVGRSKEDVLERIRNIEFTGGGTKISDSVELAVEEISNWRRQEAKLIVVLLSDGHGQELWHRVQSAAGKLQATGAEIFAATSSTDFNFNELLIYAGADAQVFVGPKYAEVVDAVASLVDCNHEKSVRTIEDSASESSVNSDSLLQSVGPSHEEQNPEVSRSRRREQTYSAYSIDSGKSIAAAVKELAARAHNVKSLTDAHCLVDLVLVIDRSQSVDSDFRKEISTAASIVEMVPPEEYASGRIHIGAVSFAMNGKVEFGFEETRNRTELAERIRRIEHTGGSTSLVSGVAMALDQVVPKRREGAKLILVLLSDGYSQDYWRQLVATAKEVAGLSNAVVYAATVSRSFSQSELQTWTGDASRVYSGTRNKEFIKTLAKELRAQQGCSPATTKIDDEDAEKGEIPVVRATKERGKLIPVDETLPRRNVSKKMAPAPKTIAGNSKFLHLGAVGPIVQKIHGILIQDAKEAELQTAAPATTEPIVVDSVKESSRSSNEETTEEEPLKIHIKSESRGEFKRAEGPLAASFSIDGTNLGLQKNCKVDLVFVIDTSGSVEEEFQKQLQFAVDLVKRLPETDFAGRAHVAIITFYKTATLQFKLGELKDRNTVLEKLLAIKHTGGSTSVVSGINAAVDEIERGRRRDARQIVVLVSDGNSQDHWERVLEASQRLRDTNADVYAVTVSHDYFFRELELYTGNKWFVYIDARIRQFLDEAETSITHCQKPLAPASTPAPKLDVDPRLLETTTKTSTPLKTSESVDLNTETTGSVANTAVSSTTAIPALCDDDIVDLVLILDTSTSVAKEFYAEKNFALDLIKVLPDQAFKSRVRVAIVHFAGHAKLHSSFGAAPTRGDVLYELERIEHTGGQTSLVAATNATLAEISSKHRKNARLVVVFVSDGNSQDELETVQATAKKLRSTGGEIYAVTLSEKYYLDELVEYTGNKEHVYVGDRIEKFIQDVGTSVLSCPRSSSSSSSSSKSSIPLTLAPVVEISVTPSPSTPLPKNEEPKSLNGQRARPKDGFLDKDRLKVVARDPAPLVRGPERCSFSKLDLQIILDASTSREEVFEHQRELALSLIERLPISRTGTHVAVGVNSFTSAPTLRQNLGLGREKEMVRQAIEKIPYRGGSTLTSKAVELSIQDLKKGRRKDAKQVVVLMNDGMSQDLWESVVNTANLLKGTGAELFGVALGEKVDLRELKLYIGDESRIYRDGSTEKFLEDVVSLLTNGSGEKCLAGLDEEDDGFEKNEAAVPSPSPAPQSPATGCEGDLDLVLLIDNSDQTPDKSDPSLNANRYLILDVLGSLLHDAAAVRVAVISFGGKPKLELDFTKVADRDKIFAKIEAIEAISGKAKYADAVDFAIQTLNKGRRRPDAPAAFVILGDGNGADNAQKIAAAGKKISEIKGGAQCLAVDSGKDLNEPALTTLTGSADRVFSYDRNADFAMKILQLATAQPWDCEIQAALQPGASPLLRSALRKKSVPTASAVVSQRRDIAASVDGLIDKDTKVVEKLETVGTTKRITPRPTTVSTTIRTRTTTSRATTTFAPGTTVTRGSPVPINSREPTTPSFADITLRHFGTTKFTEEPTTFRPGCLADVLLVLDSSGSVEETFLREKELASDILDRLRIGPNNAKVALIKFASAEKVRTVWSFESPQSRLLIRKALHNIPFSSGTTAIHAALLQTLTEYSSVKGARPGAAKPIAIFFTDGFGQKELSEEAALLHTVIPDTFAVAINHEYPINRAELEKIAGSPERVFTDANIGDFHAILERFFRDC